nr:hypothetical protein [Tanacetum cinerariifolium]
MVESNWVPTTIELTYAFLLFVMLLLMVPRAGHDSDMSFWVAWAKDIYYHGLGAFWAASLVRERHRRFGLVLLLLFNIGYLYDTVIWVQVDAIYTFFAFGAVVLAVQRRAVASMLLFVLALAAKTQAVIFLPPLLLLWLPLWWQRPQRLLWSLGSGALLATLVLAPFIWFSDENYLPHIIKINLEAANTYPMVSMNAFNLWYLVSDAGLDLSKMLDAAPFAGLTYHTWGLLMFFMASALALLPLLLLVVRTLRRPALPAAVAAVANRADLARALLSIGLIPLIFAFFNTQMHERYWHAAVLFLAAYGFLRHDYVLYVIVSVAYFLNLEAVLRYLELRNYSVAVLDPRWCRLSLAATSKTSSSPPARSTDRFQTPAPRTLRRSCPVHLA